MNFSQWRRWWGRKYPSGIELLLTLYALIGLGRLPAFRYQINPDGVAYIDLARLYADGQWWTAINAYWSPMFSWLLAPFIAIGLDPLIAGKLVQLGGGAGLLVAMWLLSRHWRPRWMVWSLLGAMAVVVLSWALTYGTTPDLVLAALVVGFLAVLMRVDFELRARWAIGAGLLAGLAYLTKSYALPFMLILTAGWYGWQLWQQPDKRQRWLKQAFIMGAVWLALVVPWVLLISWKEGRLTTGTAGAYALALFGPVHPLQPMFTRGFLEPPPGGTSVWTDPTLLDLTPPGGRAWLSPSYQWFLYQQAQRNIASLWLIIQETWLLWLTGLIVGTVTTWGSPPSPQRRLILGLLTSMGLYTAGYLIIFVELRYLWPVLALGVVVSMAGLSQVYRRWPYSQRLYGGIVLGAVLLLAQPAIDRLQEQQGKGAIYPEAAERIAALSDNPVRVVGSRGHWDESLYVSYFLGARYAGTLPPGSPEESFAQLAVTPVDILLVWDDPRRPILDYPGCQLEDKLASMPVAIFRCTSTR